MTTAIDDLVERLEEPIWETHPSGSMVLVTDLARADMREAATALRTLKAEAARHAAHSNRDALDRLRVEDELVSVGLSRNAWEDSARINRARAEAAEADRDHLAEALTEIVRWSEAYPITVFPEPDFAKARKLLEDGGMTLDAISASNMRHVVDGVGNIARHALSTSERKSHD